MKKQKLIYIKLENLVRKKVKQMKKTKKKLKKILANMLLYTIMYGMWTSMVIYGVMAATTLN